MAGCTAGLKERTEIEQQRAGKRMPGSAACRSRWPDVSTVGKTSKMKQRVP